MAQTKCDHDTAAGATLAGAGDVAGSSRCCVWQGRPVSAEYRSVNILNAAGKYFAVETSPRNMTTQRSEIPWVSISPFLPLGVTGVQRGTFVDLTWEIANVTDEGLLFLKHPTDPMIVACAAVELQGCGRNELHVSRVIRVAGEMIQINSPTTSRVESCGVRWKPDIAQNCNQGLPRYPTEVLEINLSFTFERTAPRPCALPPTSTSELPPTFSLDVGEHSTAFPLLTVGIIATAAVALCLCAIALVCCGRRYLSKVLPKSVTSSQRNCSIESSSGTTTDKGDFLSVLGNCIQDHWYLRPECVSGLHADVHMGGHTTRTLERGLLHGTTEVAVITAKGDRGNQELIRELHHLRRATHVNVVNLLGMTVSSAQQQLQLVIEWVPGSSFDVYVSRRRQDASFATNLHEAAEDAVLPEHQLLIDAARAMQYLHSVRPAIGYKVLKPSKLLVNELVSPPQGKLRITHASVASKSTEEAVALQHQDVFDFGLVVLFAVTTDAFPDATQVAAAVNAVEQLGTADVGSLFWAAKVIKVCLADPPSVRLNFSDVYHMLNGAQH
eukprot:CAMPEP_0172785104 /NCGR_PEP_ID=MMETSP1074-20121228/205277_1 /TAXON_ID=2916 /ORGANISM="Ceratium fusus, Strain PA161109" /LENGTH=554 /DNA_ID=CAMNT_0013622109 /DNA_START=42 /DNA_END=1706 /DNA_ORIENTATION=-